MVCDGISHKYIKTTLGNTHIGIKPVFSPFFRRIDDISHYYSLGFSSTVYVGTRNVGKFLIGH